MSWRVGAAVSYGLDCYGGRDERERAYVVFGPVGGVDFFPGDVGVNHGVREGRRWWVYGGKVLWACPVQPP